MLTKYQSSRNFAVLRLGLIFLFCLWAWRDPEIEANTRAPQLAVLGGYIAFALVLAVIAWNSWWLDFRLSRLALLIDALAFIASLSFTQSFQTDFISPYFSVFAFLILSAGIRWGRRAMLMTALLLVALFVVAGIVFHWSAALGDPSLFLRRIGSFSIMALVLIWFAAGRGYYQVPHYSYLGSGPEGSLLAEAIGYAMRVSRSGGAGLAWAPNDEPRTAFQTGGLLGDHTAYLPPDTLDGLADALPSLFDNRRNRALVLTPGGWLRAEKFDKVATLAAHLDIQEGVVIPLEGATGQGQLVLTGITGLCWDHIFLGLSLGRKIASALDEAHGAAIEREVVLSRFRQSLARDLHDSVAQTLAGTRFRLDALRAKVAAGGDIAPDLDLISNTLGEQQKHIRSLIDGLRSRESDSGLRELGFELRALAKTLEAQWNLTVSIVDAGIPAKVPVSELFEIQQMVREGVANAARHGQARQVTIAGATTQQGGLTITISDDGTGIPAGRVPRSIAERVAVLDGNLAIASVPGDTRLTINLPQRSKL